MTDQPFSEYAQRNSIPILKVLRREFENCKRVLEIGSGTGQHAAHFAKELPHLQWQTSDLEQNHAGIQARVRDSGLANLLPPLSLDVLTGEVQSSSYDAVFSANTAHIMNVDAVHKMFELVGGALADNGVFCLYGPFQQGGNFNTPSNAAFHESLRSRNAAMGIRHLESLDDYASENHLQRVRLFAMPANNHIIVWQKDSP